MKHRIRRTGEIISVITFSGTTEERSTDRVSYIDSKGYHHTDVQMNYYWDLEEVDESKEIDWEQRRYEIARDILAAIYSNSDSSLRNELNSFGRNVYDSAIAKAETLIAHLKNK